MHFVIYFVRESLPIGIHRICNLGFYTTPEAAQAVADQYAEKVPGNYYVDHQIVLDPDRIFS